LARKRYRTGVDSDVLCAIVACANRRVRSGTPERLSDANAVGFGLTLRLTYAFRFTFDLALTLGLGVTVGPSFTG